MRIAVSLKGAAFSLARWIWQVSIRRADRCLAEARAALGLPPENEFQSAVRIAVSLKIETQRPYHGTDKFQSAVRIAVSLKHNYSL